MMTSTIKASNLVASFYHPSTQFLHNDLYATFSRWDSFVPEHCYVQLFLFSHLLSTPHIHCGYFPGSNRLLLGKKTPAIPIFKFFRLKHDEQRVDLRPSAAALLPSLSRPKTPYLRAFCSLFRVRKYEQYQRTSRLSLTCSYYAAFKYWNGFNPFCAYQSSNFLSSSANLLFLVSAP